MVFISVWNHVGSKVSWHHTISAVIVWSLFKIGLQWQHAYPKSPPPPCSTERNVIYGRPIFCIHCHFLTIITFHVFSIYPTCSCSPQLLFSHVLVLMFLFFICPCSSHVLVITCSCRISSVAMPFHMFTPRPVPAHSGRRVRRSRS